MIICSGCHATLDADLSKPTEYKLCHKCVIKQAPAADLSKLATPENQFAKPTNGQAKQEERLKSIELGFDYELINGEHRVVFEMRDYFKKPFFGFALGKKELKDFIADIEALEDEEPT